MSTELVWLDATELAGLVASREITAVEVVEAHLARIAAVGDQVNAVRHRAGPGRDRPRRS